MAADKRRKPDQPEKEPELKGTLISVSLVGVFLLVSWIGVFALFLAR